MEKPAIFIHPKCIFCLTIMHLLFRISLMVKRLTSRPSHGLLVDLIIHLKLYRIKQTELAEAAGVSPAFITYCIQGERRFSDEQVRAIRKRFPRMPERLFKRAA